MIEDMDFSYGNMYLSGGVNVHDDIYSKYKVLARSPSYKDKETSHHKALFICAAPAFYELSYKERAEFAEGDKLYSQREFLVFKVEDHHEIGDFINLDRTIDYKIIFADSGQGDLETVVEFANLDLMEDLVRDFKFQDEAYKEAVRLTEQGRHEATDE